eukprot:CAMPEP_0201715574 /NCGR_PEP_ID=MMETSP0593-20130828/1709_1 /ASSEMBLY_ACC=CAM_ASM_000672 /TAXON_ID=267983 /ORGANISM="Skeletonema japonicum, Strain CCMP2506" /LENGTH=337 /DNA_ID=CAMNT_0048205097 /DNA_START=102 /DNA_END=1112 /DNA_ORIENTATION=+
MIFLRRGRVVASLAAMAGLFVAISTLYTTSTNNSHQTLMLRSYQRALSNVEPLNEAATVTDGAVSSIDPKRPYGNCEIPRSKFANHPVETVYQPAFPGSGSRMTYELVAALTGMTISNDHNYAVDPNVRRHVVSVKTHYPNRNGISLEEFDDDFHGALLVIRNPIKAIPSFFNFWYERINHLENHSVRAPTEEWIAFRDANLEIQLQSWAHHMDYWLKKYSKERSKLLVLPYEYLIDNKRGPDTALKLATFLDSAKGVNVANPEDVACVWHRSVKYMDEGLDVEGHSVRVGSTATPYTQAQFNQIRATLQKQKWKYKDDPQVFKIMDQYMRHINHSW